MDFKFVKSEHVQDTNQLLLQLGKMLEKEKDQGLASNFKIYFKDRENYIKNFNGKYIQISNKGIKVTDLTKLDDKDTGFSSKYEGMLMKVGDEFEQHTNTLLSWSYNPPTNAPTLDITFGNSNMSHTGRGSMLLDTGCQVTTLSTDVLKWIRSIDPGYVTRPTTSRGVGGDAVSQNGPILIRFCGKDYVTYVQYTDLTGLPFVGLIGMDLFNDGLFSIDTGTQASFTRH